MSKKEEKAMEYADKEVRRYHQHSGIIEKYGMERARMLSEHEAWELEEAYEAGWNEALKNILVDASKELPEYDVDVWVINEMGYQFFCHRSNDEHVVKYKDDWCNYTGSDIIAWIRPISFDEILSMNKDVLTRLKNK